MTEGTLSHRLAKLADAPALSTHMSEAASAWASTATRAKGSHHVGLAFLKIGKPP